MRGTRSWHFLHALALIVLLLPATAVQSQPIPPTAVIVSEDFEPMQEQWQPVPAAGSASWLIVNGTYRSRGVLNHMRVIGSYRGVRPADPPTQTLDFDQYTFRVRMRNQGIEETRRAGLVYQFQDANNFYRVSVPSGGQVNLERVLNGVATVVAGTFAGTARNVWHDVELQWNRGRTTLKIDGIVVFAEIEQNEFTSGQVGLHADGAEGAFDNVFVGVPFGDQPFTENFSDGVAQGWTPVSGQWGVAGGTYNDAAVQATSITLAPIHTAPDRTRSFTLSARMLNPYHASGNRVGIVFNYVASGSRVEYNEVVFSPTGIAQINRVVNRVVQTLATASYDGRSNRWFEVKVELDTAVSVTVDGATVFTDVAANPNTIPTGRAGLITHWAPGKFDDVSFDHGVFQALTENFDAGVPPSAVRVGTWNAAGGVLRNASVNQTDLVALGSRLDTDFVYQARLLNEYGASGNLVGLIYNYQDANSGLEAGDYYEVVFSARGAVMVRKFIQGEAHTLATANIDLPRNTWFDVEVMRRGISTSVKVNGTAVISNVTQGQLGPGRVGVITHWSKGRFDDLSVMAGSPEPFTQLLDTSIGLVPEETACPLINDNGQVAVRVGWLNGQRSVLRLTENGEFTRIVSTGTQPSGENFSSLAFFGLAINASGQVLTSVGVPGAVELAIRGDAAGYQVVADPRTSDFNSIGVADLNDAGLSVVLAGLDDGAFGLFGLRASGGRITYLTTEPPSIFHGSFSGPPRVDNSGTIVTSATHRFIEPTGEENFYVSVFTIDPSGNATLRLGPYGTQDNILYGNIQSSVRNEHDEIVLGAGVGSMSSPAILRLKDGELSIVAQAQGSIDFFDTSGLALNDASTVVYQGNFAGGSVLFADAGAVDRRIIGTGDALSGSTVGTLTFCAGGLNQRNQIAFLAHLADGRAGVFVADLSNFAVRAQ